MRKALLVIGLFAFLGLQGQDTTLFNIMLNSIKKHYQQQKRSLAYLLKNLKLHESSEIHYIASVPISDTNVGVINIVEPSFGFVEVYVGDQLVMRGTTPLSFAIAEPGNYEIILIYNGFQWVRTFFLQPGREYFIGVPGMEEYIVNYRRGVIQHRITYVTPYTGTIVVEEQVPCAFMDPVEFSHLLQQVHNTSFSDDKVALIRAAASQHCFTVDQALTLLREFEFDDDKLVAAKILANALINPEDAYLLADAFSFSDTKQEFLNWLHR